MHHLVLVSLLVFAVAFLGATALVVVQGLAAWRAFRRLRRTIFERLDQLGAELSRLERRSADAAAAGARLDQARARLQQALSTAAILAAAAGEASSLAGRIRGVVPRK